VGIWGDKTGVTSLKEKTGLPQEKRVDIMDSINDNVKHSGHVTAIVSLAADLSFYIDAKDKKISCTDFVRMNPESYINLVNREIVFMLMASFLRHIGYPFRSDLQGGLNAMADEFDRPPKSVGPEKTSLQLIGDPDYKAIMDALMKWQPGEMSKHDAKDLCVELEPFILMEYASKVSSDFKVAGVNDLNLQRRQTTRRASKSGWWSKAGSRRTE
jgi:hypothetical protein